MKKYLMTAAFLGLTLSLSGCYGDPGPYPGYGSYYGPSSYDPYYGPYSYYDPGAAFSFYGDDHDYRRGHWHHDDDDRWRR